MTDEAKIDEFLKRILDSAKPSAKARMDAEMAEKAGKPEAAAFFCLAAMAAEALGR